MSGSDQAVDLRLVASAAGVWACTAFGYQQLDAALAVARWLGVAILIVAVAMGARQHGRRELMATVATAALSVTLAGWVADLRLDAVRESPLTAAAESGRHLDVEGSVATRPRPVSGFAGGPMVVLVVDASYVETGHEQIELDRPLLVFAPAEAWSSLVPGTHIGFDGLAKVPRSPGEADAVVVLHDGPEMVRGPPVYQRLAAGARDGLVAAAQDGLSGDTAGLLVALTNGDTSGIADITRIQFRDSGLSHLLAVSGANVAIVIGVLIWMLRRTRTPFALQVAAAALGLAAFVAVTGPEPSVLRAAGMGVVLLAGLASGRPRSSLPALCATIIVLVVMIPSLSTSAGFVLSVAATAGIVVLAPWFTGRWERWPRWLALPLAVSAAAGLVTLPVIVLLYPVVNLGALIANVLAAPAVAPATVLGIAATVLSGWAAPLAVVCCFVAGFFVRWIELMARVFSRTGPLQIPWPVGLAGAAAAALAVAVVLLCIGFARRGAWQRRTAIGLVAVIGGVLLLRDVGIREPAGDWVFAACDVGQGDAILARAGPDAAVLVDTGPDPVLLDDCLRDLEVEVVPLLVLTHFHADHVGAVSGVLGHRPVGEVAISPLDGAAVQDSIEAMAAAYGVPVVTGEPGLGWRVGDVRVAVVGPTEQVVGSESDANNSSLILRVTVDGHTMLVTGDAELEEQQQLLDCGCLDADVLKVPHHGSATQDPDFLAASGADLALISVGRHNDYGHPAPSTVKSLEQLGMSVLRTDLGGTVVLSVVDGELVAASYRSHRPDTG